MGGERELIGRALTALDRRTGAGPLLAKGLRYAFPENWTFLLGEIALYSFIVLVATGVYLTLFFEPSLHTSIYHGSDAALQGARVSDAYGSTVHLSLDVRAGLLMRQTHHWAALVFIAAILLHLMRIFFTGAFRSPRELNYLIGLTMLVLAILEGFFGYSLPDDLISGMGLSIAYAVAMSVPVIGEQLARWFWGGQFPGADAFESRIYIIHVLLIPALLAALIAVHLALIMILRHTQFAGPGRRERNVVGLAMWPAYALRSAGLFFAVTAVLFLLGGLVQINPIWQYGPYQPWLGTNGVQPDWYMGWLIGALRLMPNFEPTLFGRTIPNPFFGGVLFPGVTFGLLYAWPWIERAVSGDRSRHHLLQRPRDNPWRTAFGAAMMTWVLVPFLAGSSDRIFVSFDIPYQRQIEVLRVVWLLLPPVGVPAHARHLPPPPRQRHAPAARLDRPGRDAAAGRWFSRSRARRLDHASNLAPTGISRAKHEEETDMGVAEVAGLVVRPAVTGTMRARKTKSRQHSRGQEAVDRLRRRGGPVHPADQGAGRLHRTPVRGRRRRPRLSDVDTRISSPARPTAEPDLTV